MTLCELADELMRSGTSRGPARLWETGPRRVFIDDLQEVERDVAVLVAPALPCRGAVRGVLAGCLERAEEPYPSVPGDLLTRVAQAELQAKDRRNSGREDRLKRLPSCGR